MEKSCALNSKALAHRGGSEGKDRGSTGGVTLSWVAQTLTKVVDLRQDRTRVRADAAEVRPGLPDQVTPTALNGLVARLVR